MRPRSTFPIISLVAIVVAAAAAAQNDNPRAGTVAAVLGGLEVVRSSGAKPLRVGDAVLVGDRFRTRAGDRAKLLLADNAVVDIGSASELVVETQSVDAESGVGETVLILNAGQIRATAPAGMADESRLEVETPAAVAFRGGDFAVSHEADAATSRVVALEGPVNVAGKVGVVGGVVELTEGKSTLISKGRLPAEPTEVGFEERARLVQATTIVGTGRRDGLDVLHPVARGSLLDPGDVPTRGRSEQAGLRLGAPQEPLADRLSADVRTNTEPLLEYRRQRPGAPSVTGVEVEF